MTIYNWQQKDWPHFRYDLTSIHEALIAIAEKSGLVSGKIAHLNQADKTEAQISLMMEEAVKTSEIEGEYISRPDVRSSIRNKLDLNPEKVHVHDKRAQGIVDMMFVVRDDFDRPLSDTMLFDWHAMLFSGSHHLNLQVACWRKHEEPMQIISGHYGKQTIHFEAPPSTIVPVEMQKYIKWFNETARNQKEAIKYAPVRAAIAHLYFESIHPFEDGNGRIGRAIAEKALFQGAGAPLLLSLSNVIESDKKAYYAALNAASKSIEITPWIQYFVNVILNSFIESEKLINFILIKSAFLDRFAEQLNDRQLKVIKRMFDAGINGFEGGMSAKKYMAITGTSKATATRDLQQLHEMKALHQIGKGRSVRYELFDKFILF